MEVKVRLLDKRAGKVCLIINKSATHGLIMLEFGALH